MISSSSSARYQTFKVNPYFVNTKLTKTVEFSDDGTLRSVGTSIQWKEGKVNNHIEYKHH